MEIPIGKRSERTTSLDLAGRALPSTGQDLARADDYVRLFLTTSFRDDVFVGSS